MVTKKRVLVFPCGSEVALEVYDSLKNSAHFEVFGASSVEDHGKFVFENYIADLPFFSTENFIIELSKVVTKFKIDLIYPAMDAVICKLKENENQLGAIVVSSPFETTTTCLSKSKTYKILNHKINTPKLYSSDERNLNFPVFIKPNIGYGSKDSYKINNHEELSFYLKKRTDYIICEYLEGEEYTIDCFTNKEGKLLFTGARKRERVSNGISVKTETAAELTIEFEKIAQSINELISFRGAWFFQLKKNSIGDPILLEIASRIAGSSAVYRMQGVNFALLSCFDHLDFSVSIQQNNFKVEMDRALSKKFVLDINYNTIYIDLDDTLIVNDSVNTELIALIYRWINEKKDRVLITKHKHNLPETLQKYHLETLFTKVIHLEQNAVKSEYITEKEAIFIDDSYAERMDVFLKNDIPVFSIDCISGL
jgi:hypothetical protein